MSYWFFRLRHGKDFLQPWEGVELADLAAARHEACLIARSFMDPRSTRILPAWDGWWIEVRNGKGECLLDMSLDAAGTEGLLGRRLSGARVEFEDDGEAVGRVLYLTPRGYRRGAPE